MDQNWQIKIKIIQTPEPYIPSPFEEKALLEWQEPELIRTYFFDPINSQPPQAFGLELIAGQKFDMNFITNSTSKESALELAHSWLTSLRHIFRGLDGEIFINRLPYNLHLHDENTELLKVYELELPEGLIKKRINIIEKFINIFYHSVDDIIRMYIFWQRGTNIIDKEALSNIFHVRIFVVLGEDVDPEHFAKKKGLLTHLNLDILNSKSFPAQIKECKDISEFDLLRCDVFREINSLSNGVIKEDLDFDFPLDIPLPKSPILDDDIVRYIDLNENFIKRSCGIGNHVKNGIVSNHRVFIPINKLVQDMAIFGKPGTGKTCLLASIIKELVKKARNLGILVLNIAKESQDRFYKDFQVLKYRDAEFQVPYYVEGKSPEKSLQETATYICASLGLKNVFEKMIYRTMNIFIQAQGKLPEMFIELLVGVEKYLKQNPYGSEVQSNLIQALRNRIKVFDEVKIQAVMQQKDVIPKWIVEWLNGENIFVDLSMCNKFTKMLIVNAIFQLIRCITHDTELEELKYLIVIDEAHAILEKPITNNSDDADFIMKEQMVKIFSELLKEYRSRGVGFIIADQSPTRLFDDATSQPSIKIIFREDFPHNHLFSEDIRERNLIKQLPNQVALLLNGATGEKCLIKTDDYERSYKN